MTRLCFLKKVQRMKVDFEFGIFRVTNYCQLLTNSSMVPKAALCLGLSEPSTWLARKREIIAEIQ